MTKVSTSKDSELHVYILKVAYQSMEIETLTLFHLRGGPCSEKHGIL